jgi:aspartate oxidase
MKMILLHALFFVSINARSQDAKVRQIDSIVNVINKSNLKAQKDSILKDYSELGLTMKTYVTVVVDGNELKKYINNVHSVTQENGIEKQTVSSSTFYYNQNKLIKVDEFIIEENRKGEAEWYFSDDKPFFSTLLSEKSQERAALLLTMAKAILKEVIK